MENVETRVRWHGLKPVIRVAVCSAMAAIGTAPLLAGEPTPKPADPKPALSLTEAEVMQETPGMVDAALAGPLKDVPDLVYAVGAGIGQAWFSPSMGEVYGWGADYKRYKVTYPSVLDGTNGCALYRVNPRTGQRTAILQNPKGAIGGLCVDYDGQRIVFAYVSNVKATMGSAERFAHLYEIHPDGSGLRQLTDGLFEDIEPCFLPNGEIVFSSSRCKRFIGCCGFGVRSLFLCNADGTNIRQQNGHLEDQECPSVLADGRVAFSQYEYTSCMGAVFLGLAMANPDGSAYSGLAGPVFGTRVCFAFNTLRYPRQVPGTHEVALVYYTDECSDGDLGWIVRYDIDQGPADVNAMHFISPHKSSMNWATSFDVSWDTIVRKNGYSKSHKGQSWEMTWGQPYPLSKDCMLVTTKGAVHVMDDQGHHQTLFKETDKGCIGWVQPLAPRPREPIIPSQINPHRDTGTFIIANANLSQSDVDYHATQLLILEELPRPVPGWQNTGSLGSGYFLDRVIGTVPIEADGSAYFEAPADRELFFVLLDAHSRAIKKMRSWTALKPGETRSCIGCHEKHTSTPVSSTEGTLVAVRRPPSKPFRAAYVPDIPSFHRHIQPILDRYCIKCHDSTPSPGKPMLTGDLTLYNSLAYDQLRYAKQYEVDIENNIGADKPNSKGSAVSPLLDKLTGGHHDVHATPEEIELVQFWIDSGATYAGTYAASQHVNMWYFGDIDKITSKHLQHPQMTPCDLAGLQRCDSCHVLEAGGRAARAPYNQYSWPFARDGTSYGGRRYFVNLTHPEKSLLLLAPLPRSAGGLGLCGGKPGDWQPKKTGLANGTPLKPGETRKNDGIFTDQKDPDYIKLLASIQDARKYLYEDVTRHDTPNFRPPAGWIWFMKHWGYLDPELDPMTQPIDVYAVEQKYWDSLYPKAIPVSTTAEKH